MKQYLKYFLLIILILCILLSSFYKISKKECFLNTKCKKTIYLIWRNKIKDSKTNHGFGDKLRGAIFLNQYCKKNKLNLNIDASDDICSKYLKNVVSSEYDIIKNKKIINLGDKTNNEVKETIEKLLLEQNTIYIYSNGYPNELTDDDKIFAKYICEPKDDLKNEINTKIKDLPNNFGIKHFRFNDNIFNTDITIDDIIFKKYYDLLLEKNLKTDILFTNSNNFKTYAKENLQIKTIDCNNELCKIQHTGESFDEESVKNSFIEFLIISKAKYITSYSCYDWPSNFVMWPAKIYNIPFYNVYVNEKI
jgi:hypothetical protein